MNIVNLLLNGFEVTVTNNGYLSDWFDVSRSCHQGCPAVPTLMILCAEVMSHTFKNNLLIQPYSIPSIELEQLISQFADDTQLFTGEDSKSLEGVANTFDVLHQNIGFTVNYDKSYIFR